MPAGDHTLTQLVRINDRRLSGGVTDELLEEAPLVARMAALPASNGTDHKWLSYNQAPPVGFRDLNDGIDQGHAADIQQEISCKILDASYTLDTRSQGGYSFGDLISRQSMRHLRTAFQKLERQILNGNVVANGSSWSDTSGFPGLPQGTPNTDTPPDGQGGTPAIGKLGNLAEEMVIGAGGTTNLTSVYLIRSMDPLDSAAIVTGEDGNITVAPAVRQRVPGSTGHYGAWFVEICSWYAYQHASRYTASRICNVDSQATTPVVTDDLIAQSLALFPANRQPNLCVMNRASLKQLRESRTAVNSTGAPAPFPTEVHGLEIIVTDQLSNAETAIT